MAKYYYRYGDIKNAELEDFFANVRFTADENGFITNDSLSVDPVDISDIQIDTESLADGDDDCRGAYYWKNVIIDCIVDERGNHTDFEAIRLEELAQRVSNKIGFPIEVEYDNPGGYGVVLWLGANRERCICCDTVCDSYDAITDAWNKLMAIEAVAEVLNK